jgi:uncharacterized protein involved in exopolysaccharide biosynthesis
VETNSAVYVELRRQMELAKIDEVKNIQVVQVLDTAHPPVKKSKPRRTVIVLGAMMATFLGAVGWNLAKMRLELDPSGDGAQVIARVRTDLLGRWKRDQLR